MGIQTIDEAITASTIATVIPMLDLITVLVRKRILSTTDLLQQFPPQSLDYLDDRLLVSETVRSKISDHLVNLSRMGL